MCVHSHIIKIYLVNSSKSIPHFLLVYYKQTNNRSLIALNERLPRECLFCCLPAELLQSRSRVPARTSCLMQLRYWDMFIAGHRSKLVGQGNHDVAIMNLFIPREGAASWMLPSKGAGSLTPDSSAVEQHGWYLSGKLYCPWDLGIRGSVITTLRIQHYES